MTRRKRILVYAQHLSGVGHHVRIREIARALAAHHRVAFVQGGRPVPRPDDGSAFEHVELPPIRRGPQGIEPLAPELGLADVLAARAAKLERAAAELAPDVLVVEHYPFSKWELEPEIERLTRAARAANPGLVRVASVRDIPKRTRHETGSGEAYQRRVVDTLNAGFDALLVHADPGFTRLEEHFEAARELALPLTYTGFVSEKPGLRPHGDGSEERRVVVSTGGGAGSAPLVERIVEAWALIVARGADGGRRLRVFSGLFWSDAEARAVRKRAEAVRCDVFPFTTDFLRQVEGADLSISRAGYNTCTNLLETRCRALLLPDPRMSDQRFRAQRMAEHGLARVVAGEAPTVAELAEAIVTALRRERPQHGFDLDGARRTCELLSR